jgi:hypothetical protein
VKQPQQLIKEEADKIEDLQVRMAELRQRVCAKSQFNSSRFLTNDVESGSRCEESPIP